MIHHLLFWRLTPFYPQTSRFPIMTKTHQIWITPCKCISIGSLEQISIPTSLTLPQSTRTLTRMQISHEMLLTGIDLSRFVYFSILINISTTLASGSTDRHSLGPGCSNKHLPANISTILLLMLWRTVLDSWEHNFHFLILLLKRLKKIPVLQLFLCFVVFISLVRESKDKFRVVIFLQMLQLYVF